MARKELPLAKKDGVSSKPAFENAAAPAAARHVSPAASRSAPSANAAPVAATGSHPAAAPGTSAKKPETSARAVSSAAAPGNAPAKRGIMPQKSPSANDSKPAVGTKPVAGLSGSGSKETGTASASAQRRAGGASPAALAATAPAVAGSVVRPPSVPSLGLGASSTRESGGATAAAAAAAAAAASATATPASGKRSSQGPAASEKQAARSAREAVDPTGPRRQTSGNIPVAAAAQAPAAAAPAAAPAASHERPSVVPRLGLGAAPAAAPATAPDGTGDDEDESEYMESEDFEPEKDLSFLSPVRLRMGWRQNGELEKKTAMLSHMLDMLGPVGEKLASKLNGEPPKRTKADVRNQVNDMLRRFEAQQARLEVLERELEASRATNHQAIMSRAEMAKRVEEEKARANQLQGQLDESKSKLARALRQVELLKGPGQVEEDPEKPRPMHERVSQEMKKRTEKIEAVRSAAESNRTYAPAIDPSSANIAKKSTTRVTPAAGSGTPAAAPMSLSAAAKAAEAKADQQDSVSATAQELAALSAEERNMVKDMKTQMNKDQIELSTEKRLREAAEAAATKATAAEKFALERRAEIELTLQKMANKERDQTAELQMALKTAREAKGELDAAKRLAEAAQSDAATKAAEAQRLARERAAWEVERLKARAEKEEAIAQAAEQTQRSEAAEKALKEIAGTGAPSASSAQARQVRGQKDSPNAEAVQKQQAKAKIEKAKIQMEEEKRSRAKAERELQRAVEEQQRLQSLLANAINSAGTEVDAAARQAAAEAVQQVSGHASSERKANAPAAAAPRSAQGKNSGGRSGSKGGGGQSSVQEMQRHLRTEAEETVLLREVKEMDEELHAARDVANSASSRVVDEQQRRLKAETALERYTRITALQRAATEALQFGMSSPGGGDDSQGQSAEEALQRLAAEIRASGLASSSPRTNHLEGTPTPRTEQAMPSVVVGDFTPTTRADPSLFVRSSPSVP